jgi:hypothetical protein
MQEKGYQSLNSIDATILASGAQFDLHTSDLPRKLLNPLEQALAAAATSKAVELEQSKELSPFETIDWTTDALIKLRDARRSDLDLVA